MTAICLSDLPTGPDSWNDPASMTRRVVLTLPGDGCAAIAEDLGVRPRRFVSVLFDGADVAERRYCAEEAVAVRHAHAMLDEQTRRSRGAA